MGLLPVMVAGLIRLMSRFGSYWQMTAKSLSVDDNLSTVFGYFFWDVIFAYEITNGSWHLSKYVMLGTVMTTICIKEGHKNKKTNNNNN